MNNRNKRSDPDSELYSAILKLQTVEECYDFFTDLCTFSELKAMEQRFELAKLLNDGLIYNDILEKTGASSATISRVNRSLNYGMGAYRIIFDRMKAIRESARQPSFLHIKSLQTKHSLLRISKRTRERNVSPRVRTVFCRINTQSSSGCRRPAHPHARDPAPWCRGRAR